LIVGLTIAAASFAAASPGIERIPAESPIGGPFWSLVVPALLLAVAFLATWLLYRRFADD
jgi:TRAP-type C4-dicarboxylate transport system permease large subunit